MQPHVSPLDLFPTKAAQVQRVPHSTSRAGAHGAVQGVLAAPDTTNSMDAVPWGGAFGFACYESRGWGFSGLTSLSHFRNCLSLFKRKKEKQGKDL